MERILTLSKKEQNRLLVLKEVEKRKMGVREAAEDLGFSERIAWPLMATGHF